MRAELGVLSLSLLLGALAAGAPPVRAAAQADPPPARGEESAQEGEEEILGRPAGLDLGTGDVATVPAAAGARLFAEPAARSPLLAVIDADSELPLVDERGGWRRVRYGALLGWLAPPGEAMAPPAPPPAPDAATPPPLPRPDPVAERLARARAVLGGAAVDAALGRWPLVTDVGDRRLLARLDAVATHLGEAYAERYRLDPSTARGRPVDGEPGERAAPVEQAVVLFAEEASYRAYQRGDEGLVPADAAAYAGGGVAALWVGPRRSEEIAALLVHELSHLLNRHALGTVPAPWLEEGMANDLAFCRLSDDGRLRLGTLGGRFVEGRRVVRLAGPQASLNLLREASVERRLPPLATLVDLAWREWVGSEERSLLYAQAAFFVRYLLDAERGRRAEAFRTWLAELAAGRERPDAELAEALGGDWRELEDGFAAWLRFGAGSM